MTKIKLIILFILLLTISSCKGQKSKNKSQNLTSKIDSTKPKAVKKSIEETVIFPDFTKQINQVVRTVFQDSKKNIWFGTESGAFKFNGESLIFINNITNKHGKGVTIKDITESKDGKIWFGHSSGISSIDNEFVTNYHESNGLISNDVWCITSDTKGNIWIGTYNGVSVFDGQKFSNFNLPEGIIDPTLGVSSKKMIHHIMEDSKGILWFCTNAGLFSFTNNKLINVSKKMGIKTNFVNQIFEDKKGELWVSTKKGLYNLKGDKIKNITEGKITEGKGIGSISEDKNGKIWFVSNQHFLYSYDKNKLIEYKKSEENKGPVIFKIYKDLDKRLWFVGFGGAYRLKNGKFLNITQNGPW